MKRILLLATAAAMLVAMLAVTAGAASATIHRLSCGDEQANEESSNTAQNANPPGITTSDDPDPDNAPQSNPALIVDEDEGAGGELTPEDNKDAVGEDGGPGGHANADKPGCNPPGQVE